MSSQSLLQLDGVSKRYGGLRALDGISIDGRGGEVIALLGDNGAGKSTLMKVLAGAESADSGTISIGGVARDIRSPRQAEQLGIEMVYQDLALVGTLDAASNMHLGREPRRRGISGRLGLLDRARMRRETVEHMQRLGVSRLSLRRTVTMLSGGQRQAIAIARATSRGSDDTERILLLDEPTAALGVGQQRRVQELISGLRERGMLVIVISHDLAACFEVADRLIVLRQGRKVADVRTTETNTQEVVAWITGALKGPVEADTAEVDR